MYVGIFDLEYVKVIWGHSVHSFRKLSRNSKRAHRKGKRTKIWTSGVYVTCMLVFLTLSKSRSFGVICGAPFWKMDPNQKRFIIMLISFGVIQCAFRKKGAWLKTAHHRVKRMKIAPWVCVLCGYGNFQSWTYQGHFESWLKKGKK